MTLMLWVLVGSVVLEVGLYALLWRIRTPVILLLAGLTTFGSISYFMADSNGLSAAILIVGCYRLVNYARILVERLHPYNLFYSSAKTSTYLSVLQLLLVGSLLICSTYTISPGVLWATHGILNTAIALLLLVCVIRTIFKTRLKKSETAAAQITTSLPSITVAIPARNETEQLEIALRALVASDYPKLEIIVLDDCSQNKRTPEIIRGFAQDGVRFLAGELPKDGWLAKNQAYQKLLEAASGEYIVFMGVDVMVEPHSLRTLVSTLIAKQKSMMSVLPLRSTHASGHYSLTQPMRYFWELVPPRRLFNRPPVLSSCWIASRVKLLKYGSFKAVSNSVSPEAYFAKRMVQDGDSYSFLRGNQLLGVRSVKSSEDQQQTALRTRYPQLHRRLELVATIALGEVLILLAPFIISVLGFFVVLPEFIHLLAGISAGLLALLYMLVAFTTRINPTTFALFALPLVLVNDVWLLHYSLYKYEFSSIDWKGRNVCVPVMKVIPHLPKLD